ncbi:MAG: hypothetical protein Ct9H300mP11_22810 [Chloroflexota bacterium]|nr:MAG: hypothetical protein Ct9H300mP11_22810 [Chloroflexota bacterium]
MVAKDKQPPGFRYAKSGTDRSGQERAIRIAERAPKADRERKVPVENIRDLHEAGPLKRRVSPET